MSNTRNNADEVTEDLIIDALSSNYIKTSVIPVKNHLVFLDEDIGDAAKYRDLRNLLYTANEFDSFTFLINNCGGQLYTALGIIEAMHRTEATIHSIVEGHCMSAASLIMLSSDEITITDSAVIMCHSASHGVVGSTQSVKSQADFMDKTWKSLEKKVYSGFLSATELSDMGKGVEYYFDADETRTRLANWLAKKKEPEATVQKKTRKPASK